MATGDPIPAAPKCGYCDQPATTSNGNCTEHWGRPPAGEWAEPDARKRADAEAREYLAERKLPNKIIHYLDETDNPNGSYGVRFSDVLAAYASKISAERNALRVERMQAERNASHGRAEAFSPEERAIWQARLFELHRFADIKDCASLLARYEATVAALTVELADERKADAEIQEIVGKYQADAEAAESQLAALRHELELEQQSHDAELRRLADAIGTNLEGEELNIEALVKIMRLLAALRQQVEKLKPYLRHIPRCGATGCGYMYQWREKDAEYCNCGLAAALKEPSAVQKGKNDNDT